MEILHKLSKSMEKRGVAMATLADVAKRANVSKMTVSRVMNHPEQVTDELRALVFEAMEALHYRPNIAAKALSSQKTGIVRVLILEDIDTTEPYYMLLLFGIAKGLDSRQYALQLVTDRDFEREPVDGYIVTGAKVADYQWLAQLEQPVVMFGENHSGYDYVDTDNKLGTQLATQYAIDRKYQTVVFIGIDVRESFEYSREAGYINTVHQAGMLPQVVRMGNHSHESEAYVVNHWAELGADTAFICASDRLAIGVVRGISRMGGTIPDEFGVCGFDGVFLDQVSNPKLSTVKQPIQQMGELTAQMILQKIDQAGLPQGERQVPPELVVRESFRQ